MAEALEQGREAVEAVAAGIHPRQHAVEFVGDAFLFGQRGEYERCRSAGFGSKTRHIHAVTDFGDVGQKLRVAKPVVQEAPIDGEIGFDWNNFCRANASMVSMNYFVQVWAQFAVEHVTALETVLGAF